MKSNQSVASSAQVQRHVKLADRYACELWGFSNPLERLKLTIGGRPRGSGQYVAP